MPQKKGSIHDGTMSVFSLDGVEIGGNLVEHTDIAKSETASGMSSSHQLF